MKFWHTQVFSGPDPGLVAMQDELLIWFCPDGTVKLKLGGHTDDWVLWDKGRSIGECLRGEPGA